MKKVTTKGIRDDCLGAIAKHESALQDLRGKRVAMTGGTGFLGSWITETILALNDEYNFGVKLDVLAPNAVAWIKKHPQFDAKGVVRVANQDVRSPFELERDVTYVIHAAGIPDGRVHSSDPLRVFNTSVAGTGNALEAASKLHGILRFLNISSGLVYGGSAGSSGFDEDNFFPVEAGQVSNVYLDSKRAAESLCAVYRSQMRIPVVTIRPFTFVGPYQDLNRPWALNNFLRDALGNREIRVHGDGESRRSYLYGSDAACWTLVALVKGAIGKAYNVGSGNVISLKDLAEQVGNLVERRQILFRTLPPHQRRHSNFFPSIVRSTTELNVCETVALSEALEKTAIWNAPG